MELLGQGGMATIFRARDNQLARDVAVKVLRPEYGRDPDFLARFRQEARAAASLNHPNVVAVYDFGEDAQGPFIVMELVDGEDLASLVRRTGPLPPRQAARLGAEIARALAAAHAQGLVHRDVKASNVLLARDGRVKVTDFGIARALAEAQLTLPGVTLGSVHYISPEQARGEPATEASDIYSLGVVLFELLTGRRPWEGDTAAAVAMARLSEPVPAPSDHRAGIPPALDAIVYRALARDPADRFPSALALAEALEAFLAERGPAGAEAAGPPRTPGLAGAAGGVVGGTAPGRGGASDAGPERGAWAGAGASPGGPSAERDLEATVPVAAATARPNPPGPPPYPPDAYAAPEPQPRSGQRRGRTEPDLDEESDDEARGPGIWAWVAGLLGLAILAVVAYLGFQLLSAGSAAPPAEQVEVPNLVGLTVEQARPIAEALGLQLSQVKFVTSRDQPEGTIAEQSPPPGAKVARGTVIEVTIVTGKPLVVVPDLRGRPESEAINLIVSNGFVVGERTETFDPIIPAGAVVSQDPRAGLEVAAGTAISYVVSKGPEPTPTPSPSPTPTPTPEPTPTPTPPPTPTPTPPPTPTPTPEPTPPPSPVVSPSLPGPSPSP